MRAFEQALRALPDHRILRRNLAAALAALAEERRKESRPLDAVDLQAGKLLWRVPIGTTRDLAPFPFWWIKGLPGVAAPMLTASGLVFSGISNEHAFRAFDLATGEELWKARLPTAANALPMSYTAGGRQFVVVAAGGHWSGGSPPGDYLMAFALPAGAR